MFKLIKSIIKKLKHKIDLYFLLKIKGVIRYDKQNKLYLRDIRGHRFYLHPNDYGISRVLAKDGMREKESVEALLNYVKPDMNILEIGANIGFYVILESEIISKGCGKIFALEPLPANIRLLNINIACNNYMDKVKVTYGAISDHTGLVKLELSPLSNCHRLAELFGNNHVGNTIEVPSFTFTDFLHSTGVGIEDIDFLRMDIEGSEYIVMPDILEQLEKKDSFLMFIEFHPHVNLARHKELLIRLERIGYRCLTVTKEYVEKRKIKRKHFPNAIISDLYSNKFFSQQGGCEVFLCRP